jgi:hypothetical protein
MPAQTPSVPPAAEPTPPAPNRAARRGRAGRGAADEAHGKGHAPHSRGAQGRRINPIRRTG